MKRERERERERESIKCSVQALLDFTAINFYRNFITCRISLIDFIMGEH